MLFDTGSVEAITPKIATALGLSVEGAGTVRGSGERAGVAAIAVAPIRPIPGMLLSRAL